MKLCPVALAVGCVKCPIVKACPLKTVIGDYVKPGASADKSTAADTSHTRQ